MSLQSVLRQKNVSIYRLAKVSEVPYATLNDICNGKTRLAKCSAETVYRIAHALNISMEDLLEPYIAKRSSFENFKSTVCHQVKELGDIPFMANLLENQTIRMFYERQWFPESFYLLAMLDYHSRIHEVPMCSDYDDIRQHKLRKTLYPSSILALSAAAGNDDAQRRAVEESIPEFMRFNIVENETRDVV